VQMEARKVSGTRADVVLKSASRVTRLFSNRNEVDFQYFGPCQGESRKLRDAWEGIWTSNFQSVVQIQPNGPHTGKAADTMWTDMSQFSWSGLTIRRSGVL
jgi:hypothetical protein